MSGLSWQGLSPFVRVAGGRALAVPDPDHPSEPLVVWKTVEGNCLLESTAIPAHRKPISVSEDMLAYYRLDAGTVAVELAKVKGFVAQRVTAKGPLITVGFVQPHGARTTRIVMFVPSMNPLADIEAIAHFQDRESILLLPSARWAHLVSPEVEARSLDNVLSECEEEHLINLASPVQGYRTQPGYSRTPVIQVRQADRWEDVTISLSVESRSLRVRIEDRRGVIPFGVQAGEFVDTGKIFAWIAAEVPPRWSNKSDPLKKGPTACRKAFQRFCKDLQAWIPVPDGSPFRHDRLDNFHYPRFRCENLVRN